jgi:hypothetical protein
MGLLDTWQEWKTETGMFKNSSSNMEEMAKNSQYGSGSLGTAGGVQPSYTDKKPEYKGNQIQQVGRQNVDQVMQQRGLNKESMMQNPAQAGAMIAQSNKNQQGTPTGDMPSNLGDKGYHKDETDQLNWWQKLAKKAGIKDFDKAAANWKDKGGFDGLMSNPAFSLGLALMQSSANGKTINQGILDNFVKAGNISQEYKDRIKAKAGDVTEVTSGQMDSIKGVLSSVGISAPALRKLKPGNQAESYEQAVEDIAFKVQKKVSTMKAAAEASGKNIEVGSRLYKKIIQQMIQDKEIDKKGGLKIFGYNVIDSTLEAKPMAKGGPVQQGKPYLVGEQGPEIIIPHSSGDVLTNDDSQIYAMLLAANPQLQKVSRVRAQKIMRNRFPEYFEG